MFFFKSFQLSKRSNYKGSNYRGSTTASFLAIRQYTSFFRVLHPNKMQFESLWTFNFLLKLSFKATTPMLEENKKTMDVNYYGVKSVSHALFPLLKPHAR